MDSSWMTLQAWMCYTVHVFRMPHFIYFSCDSIHSTITVYVSRVLLSIAIFSDGLNLVLAQLSLTLHYITPPISHHPTSF